MMEYASWLTVAPVESEGMAILQPKTGDNAISTTESLCPWPIP